MWVKPMNTITPQDDFARNMHLWHCVVPLEVTSAYVLTRKWFLLNPFPFHMIAQGMVSRGNTATLKKNHGQYEEPLQFFHPSTIRRGEKLDLRKIATGFTDFYGKSQLSPISQSISRLSGSQKFDLSNLRIPHHRNDFQGCFYRIEGEGFDQFMGSSFVDVLKN